MAHSCAHPTSMSLTLCFFSQTLVVFLLYVFIFLGVFVCREICCVLHLSVLWRPATSPRPAHVDRTHRYTLVVLTHTIFTRHAAGADSAPRWLARDPGARTPARAPAPAQRSLALGLLKFTHRTVLRVAVPYVPRTSTLYVRASNKCSRTVEVRRVETSTLYLPPRAPSALSAPRPCPPCTTEGVGARTQSQTQRHTRHSEHGSRSRVSGEGVPSVF